MKDCNCGGDPCIGANLLEPGWQCVVERAAIFAFVRLVNERAEADMLRGNPVTGAHHRAMTFEAALLCAHPTVVL